MGRVERAAQWSACEGGGVPVFVCLTSVEVLRVFSVWAGRRREARVQATPKCEMKLWLCVERGRTSSQTFPLAAFSHPKITSEFSGPIPTVSCVCQHHT